MNTDPMEFAEITKKEEGDITTTLSFINRIRPINPKKVIGQSGEMVVAPMTILDNESCIEIKIERMDSNGNAVTCLAWIPITELDFLLIKTTENEKIKLSEKLEFNRHFGMLNTVITDISPDSKFYYLYGKTALEIVSTETIATIYGLLKDMTATVSQIRSLYNAVILYYRNENWIKPSVIEAYNTSPGDFNQKANNYISDISSLPNPQPVDGLIYFHILATALKGKLFSYDLFADKEALALLDNKELNILNISHCAKTRLNNFLVSATDGKINAGSYSLGVTSVSSPTDDLYRIDYEAYSSSDPDADSECDLSVELTSEEWIYVLTKACKICDCMTEISFLESYKHACSLEHRK